MVQWVKNPTAVTWDAVEARVQSLAWHSGLKVRCYSSFSLEHNLIPGPGTSCLGAATKEKQRIKNSSSHCGTAEMNPTSIHEDAGSIPSLAQWVGYPVLL